MSGSTTSASILVLSVFLLCSQMLACSLNTIVLLMIARWLLKIQISHPDMTGLEVEERPSFSVGVFLIKLIFIYLFDCIES